MKSCITACAVALAASSIAAAQTATVAQKNISLDAALQAATTALETCRKNGFRVTASQESRQSRNRPVVTLASSASC